MGGAVLVIPALVMALFALSAALIAAGWSQPIAYLTSAIVAAVIAGLLFEVGINRLDARNLTPHETMGQLEGDKDTVKGMVAMSNTQTGFFDRLASAVQENPLAAALIGGGALWLLSGNDRLKGAASSAAAAASPGVDIGARNLRSAASGLQRTAAPPTAPEMDHEGSFHVGETLRDASNAASSVMSGAADKIRDRFDEGVAYARENFGKLDPGKESNT